MSIKSIFIVVECLALINHNSITIPTIESHNFAPFKEIDFQPLNITITPIYYSLFLLDHYWY